RNVHGSRNTGREAVRGRIVVSAFGPVAIGPFRDGPRLHRKLPVRRVYNHSAPARGESDVVVSLQSEICATAVWHIISLEVRLTVRLPSNVRRGRRRSGGSARTCSRR